MGKYRLLVSALQFQEGWQDALTGWDEITEPTRKTEWQSVLVDISRRSKVR